MSELEVGSNGTEPTMAPSAGLVPSADLVPGAASPSVILNSAGALFPVLNGPLRMDEAGSMEVRLVESVVSPDTVSPDTVSPDAVSPDTMEVRPRLAVHEWIPMGPLSTRMPSSSLASSRSQSTTSQCRCCHCGLVRTYDFATAPWVSYSRYGAVIASGALQTAEVPACAPVQNPMPSSVGARSWDILSLL